LVVLARERRYGLQRYRPSHVNVDPREAVAFPDATARGALQRDRDDITVTHSVASWRERDRGSRFQSVERAASPYVDGLFWSIRLAHSPASAGRPDDMIVVKLCFTLTLK
jgi:hypothetical protein